MDRLKLRTVLGPHAHVEALRCGEVRSDRFDLSEVFLEIALVVTSITLLSGRRMFWHLGMLFGVLGIVVAAASLLVH